MTEFIAGAAFGAVVVWLAMGSVAIVIISWKSRMLRKSWKREDWYADTLKRVGESHQVLETRITRALRCMTPNANASMRRVEAILKGEDALAKAERMDMGAS